MLFVLSDKNGSDDLMDPFVLVNKNTGKLSGFVPTMDLEGFGDALANHEIPIDKDSIAHSEIKSVFSDKIFHRKR